MPMLTAALLSASLLAAPAAQQTCSGPVQVVNEAYRQVLERSPDASSTGFVTALDTGRMTVRDLVATLARSPEHANRFFWAPLVSAVYRQVLHRAPEQQELDQAIAKLSGQQMTVTELVADTAARAANGEEDAVRILYRRLLGRDPDAAGLRDFTQMAQRDGIAAVARAIVASPEYVAHAGPDRIPTQDFAAYQEAVATLYRHILAREPDPEGLRELTRVAATQGVDAAIDEMVGSREYALLYGNDVVPGRSGSRLCQGVATSGTFGNPAQSWRVSIAKSISRTRFCKALGTDEPHLRTNSSWQNWQIGCTAASGNQEVVHGCRSERADRRRR